jgi:ATPase subunit of ABC transporter with duplicated ATPase domains
MLAAISCSDLSFSWPDGQPVLSDVTVSIGPGRTGLIGANGSGKSTLLRLIAGELRPASGVLRITGEVGYLPQAITLGTDRSVADLLGISRVRAALHAIEGGDVSPEAFAEVGDDWDVEERALAWLDRMGIAGTTGLDSTVAQLSGGETVLVALAALFLRRPAVILLDEPTNNLDLDARQRLYDAIASWPGVLVIVSHDRDLLARVDRIVDLSAGGIRAYGGNLAVYEQVAAAEQAAAEQTVSAAAADVRRQRRDLREAQVKQATRDRQGRRLAASGSIPRIAAGAMKRHAEESAGRSGELHAERLQAARERLSEAEAAVRDDAVIRISLPDTAVPPGRTVLTVTGLGGGAWHPAGLAKHEAPPASVDTLIVRGPERIALLGPNGAGKTTLFHAICTQAALPGVTVRPRADIGYLPQRLDILDDELSVVENVRAAAPAATVNEVRASLARFLFRGKRADVLAGTLSGGERFRAVLATLLLAEPAPQLLLLDEPTNSLDMASVRQLTQALDSYQGALLIASHDIHFLRSAGITRWLRLDRAGDLTETDPL